jgi:DNA (cytosine-5)-methyltransferase 1
MRHGSLFSGIGGFDLASEWMGWENVFHCEWNPFGQKVLNYYWPNSITYNDITKTDFTIHRGGIDIITGGFPCQPYSSAGKRLGKEDERHLWPEMLRAIREIQPTWVVGENVRGLTNWNGGLVFDEVQAELEAQGYQVTPFLLPACAVNAPHRRDRIWFIAYSDNKRRSSGLGEVQKENGEVSKWDNNAESSNSNNGDASDSDSSSKESSRKSGSINSNWGNNNAEQKQWRESTEQHIGCNNVSSNASDSSSLRFCEHSSRKELFSETFGTQLRMDKQNASNSEFKGLQGCTDTGKVSSKEGTLGREGNKFTTESSSVDKQSNDSDSKIKGLEGLRGEERRHTKLHRRQSRIENWQNFPTVSPICDGDDGFSNRLDSITFPKWRNESIKAGGNAIVPQVVYQIFKAIEQYNQLDKQLSI